MLRASVPEGEGIVLMPCGSVHMAFMRFAIDVIYFDREYRVVKLVPQLKPYRASLGGRRARAAIEVRAGTLEQLDLRVGDTLLVHEPAGEPAIT